MLFEKRIIRNSTRIPGITHFILLRGRKSSRMGEPQKPIPLQKTPENFGIRENPTPSFSVTSVGVSCFLKRQDFLR